jgi:serine/threonine protein kinase
MSGEDSKFFPRSLSSSKVSTAPSSPEPCQSPKTPAVKLIDFDTVVDWEPGSPKSRDVLGSDGYIAPEAYGGIYSPSSDVYQVGVIMYKLLTKKFPHDHSMFDDKPGENWVGSPAMKRIQDRLKNHQTDFNRAPLNKMPSAVDLLKKMLAYDYAARPSAAETLDHAFFKED